MDEPINIQGTTEDMPDEPAAALFTEDAILMLPLEFAPERSGIFSGRPAIEKWYTQKFTEYHVTDSQGKLDQIHSVDSGMWAVGEWIHAVTSGTWLPTVRSFFFLTVILGRFGKCSWSGRYMFCCISPVATPFSHDKPY